MSAAEGGLNTLDVEVVGVFQSFSKDFDARAVRIHLGAAQEKMSTTGVNLLVVALDKTEDTDRGARRRGHADRRRPLRRAALEEISRISTTRPSSSTTGSLAYSSSSSC